jgi:hypothetical protein
MARSVPGDLSVRYSSLPLSILFRMRHSRSILRHCAQSGRAAVRAAGRHAPGLPNDAVHGLHQLVLVHDGDHQLVVFRQLGAR